MDPQRSITILEALVGFDTTSRNSNLGLIAWVEAYLDRLGVAHERVPDSTGQKANLWITVGPAGRPGVILSGHTDVVPVDDQSWTSDPFRLTERNGRYYGRGATDMKAFDACCLAAIPAMLNAKLSRPIHVALSHDEEVGCVGVRSLIAQIERMPVRPEMCFVGEPTGMSVVIGHKAKRSFRASVRGRTCHSALAPHGVNAVEYAARVIAKIRDIGETLSRTGARDPLHAVPFTTSHTGLVHGGTALNIVPDSCVFEFEFRSIGADDPDALGAQVIQYAKDVLEPEMKRVAPEAEIDIVLRSGFPGLDTAADSAVAQLAERLSGHAGASKVAFGTEAGLFAAAGIPSVVIGPGSIDQAHKADEYITGDEIVACGAFIERLIAYCSG